MIQEKEAENKAFKETVAILESKVENAEAELIRHFKESKNLRKSYEKEKDESAVLKDVIRKHNGETARKCSESQWLGKT